MAAIQTLTDSNWQSIIDDRPALILLSAGEGVRGDFMTQFKKSAQQESNIIFGQVDIRENPQLAETFNVRNKPVMIGYYNGEAHVRRARPWGTDIVLATELLNDKYTEENPDMADTNKQNGGPVNVSQDEFQQQVIDYSHEKPVLVDFWAEWCGPCRQVAPILDKLSREFADDIRVAKVDTDANQQLAQSFQIMSIPTIMVFKDGQLVFSQPGAFPEAAFRDLIQQVIELDVQAAIEEAERQQQNQ
jgi:thioredoxin